MVLVNAVRHLTAPHRRAAELAERAVSLDYQKIADS